MVTTVLEGGEVPPPNAFLADARAAPYYYGFHLIAAAIENVGRIGSTFWLLLAFTVLTAAAYPVVLFVVARDLFDDTRRAVTAAIGGSFLAGFDAAVWVAHAARDTLSAWPLPAGPAGLRAAVPMTSIDFWIHHNERQFTGPYRVRGPTRSPTSSLVCSPPTPSLPSAAAPVVPGRWPTLSLCDKEEEGPPRCLGRPLPACRRLRPRWVRVSACPSRRDRHRLQAAQCPGHPE